MSSRGKKKTTMAKLSRESRLRERKLDKQARKDARKNAPAVDMSVTDALSVNDAQMTEADAPVAAAQDQ
jgi:hypothetical protein